MSKPVDAFVGHFDDTLTKLLEYFPIGAVGIEKRNDASSAGVHKLCKQQRIPVFKLESNRDICQMLDPGRFRYLFVASFGLILEQSVINRVDKIINLHMGLLPQCRGRHPLPAAILNRHTKTGVTAHLIVNENIDTGPIICRTSTPIDYQANYDANEKTLRSMLSDLVPVVHAAHEAGWANLDTPAEKGNYYAPCPKGVLTELFAAKSLDIYKP